MSALPESRAAFQHRWEPYKETLRRLFLVEKQTLKEVREVMAESYDFKATESQYEHIFREWGFAKNLKGSDWIAIGHHTSKRKREGKENEVLYKDVVFPPKKVRKEILRNQRASSPRRDGVPSPKLPEGVTIRTPGASPTIQTAVPEWSKTTLPAAEDITMFRVTAPGLSQSASKHPSSQASKYADRELWTEFCDSRGHTRSDLQGSAIELGEAPPQRCPSRYFDELLLDQGLDLGLQEFTFLENFEAFNTSFDVTDPEWSTSHTGALDIFQNTFNGTPVMRQNHLSVSNWGGKHSGALYNVPWFRFQRLATEFFYSSNSPENHDHALYSPLHVAENLQVQHSIALEDRQRLLSGLFGSATTPNSLQKLPHFKSLLQDLVPERFEGDIEKKLQHFFDPLNKCSLFELTEFHLYFLSNNKFTEAQADNLLEFIAKQKPLGPLKSLLQMKTPTTQAFCDKILEFTTRCRDITSLQLLFDCGIDRSVLSGTQGGKYLQIAIAHDKLDIVEYILDNGVDVNPSLGDHFPYSRPPLHIAVRRGHGEVVKRLIDAGANLHRKDDNGDTALVYAFYWSWEPVECIQLLLEAGANVDNGKFGDLPLLDWVYLNKRHLYSMILSSSQHAKKSLTTSGILYAANASRQALSQYLNSMPPIEDWQRRNKLEVALCQAANYVDQPIEVVRILLEFGADPNVSTVCEESPPLVQAAMRNDIDLADLLLDADTGINTPDVLETAAADDDNYDILSFLIEEGADVKTFGAGALRCARFENNLAIVKLLLSSGADINDPAAPKGGRTLLQRA
ncbi:ankyrin, partial [Acephala macrosclerotiorum]